MLRHDNASQYTSSHFEQELRFLGIESSPAYVREPEGNGVAERFKRTLLEEWIYVRPYANNAYQPACYPPGCTATTTTAPTPHLAASLR